MIYRGIVCLAVLGVCASVYFAQSITIGKSIISGQAIMGSGPSGSPITYAAQTTTAVKANPALPMSGPGSSGFGAIGSMYTDADYNSNIVRVTDSTLAGTCSFSTYGQSGARAWSSDSAYFAVLNLCTGGVNVFNVGSSFLTNGLSGSTPATPATSFAGTACVSQLLFSRANSRKAFGVGGSCSAGGNMLYTYTLPSLTESTLLDVTTISNPSFNVSTYNSAGGHVGIADLTDDEQQFVLGLYVNQDVNPAWVIWWIRPSTFHVLDVVNRTIDGVSVTNWPAGETLHQLNILADGSAVMPGSQGSVPGIYLWYPGNTIDTASFGGHLGIGFGQFTREAGTNIPDGSGQYDCRLIRRANVNPYANDIVLVKPSAPYCDGGIALAWHGGWRNNQSDHNRPVIGVWYSDTISGPNNSGFTRVAWQDEIVGFQTDCATQFGCTNVYRFAHTHSIYRVGDPGTGAADFFSTLAGNTSPDGHWQIFPSNWEQSLGTDSRGSPRDDVFLLDLKSAH